MGNEENWPASGFAGYPKEVNAVSIALDLTDISEFRNVVSIIW